MSLFGRGVRVTVLGAVFVLLAACGDDGVADLADGGDDAGHEATDVNSACELLTDSEITDAIGQHTGGGQDMQFGGCVWQASVAIESGFTEAIHVAVLSKQHFESIAEIGEPITEIGGATYDEISGELWFPCRSSEFCGLKAAIGDGDEREVIAIRLGKLLRDRA